METTYICQCCGAMTHGERCEKTRCIQVRAALVADRLAIDAFHRWLTSPL